MPMRSPSLFFSVWTVPVSQLDLVETLFGSFVLNFFASNISNRYSTKSFVSLRNVLGYGIPLIVQIAILVVGIAIVMGQHRAIPQVLGQYLHLFVYCCTEEDYGQLKMALDTWRRERHEVNADDKQALNDITDRAWRIKELQSRNLLVCIFESEGNDTPRRRAFRCVIDFIENHALALLATAPATFAINMLSSDMSNSLQHKSSSVLVSAYLVPVLLQIAMTVAFRVGGKRKMNRKMFEYLQEQVKGWEAQDYENLQIVMECWRKHRGAGLAANAALETLLVIMEVGGRHSPLGFGLSSLPPRSDDGAMEALSVRDASSETDITSLLPSSPENSGANEQQELETGTLSSAQGDFIAEEVDSRTMPPPTKVNVTDEMDPVVVSENGTEDPWDPDEETRLRRRKGLKITAGGPPPGTDEVFYEGYDSKWVLGYDPTWVLGRDKGPPVKFKPKPPAPKEEKKPPGPIELKVPFCCEGCQERILSALIKMDGVDSVRLDVDAEKVTIMGKLKPEDALKEAKKVVKRSEFWPKQKEDGKRRRKEGQQEKVMSGSSS